MFTNDGGAIGGPLHAPEASSLPTTVQNHQWICTQPHLSFASEHVDFERIHDDSSHISFIVSACNERARDYMYIPKRERVTKPASFNFKIDKICVLRVKLNWRVGNPAGKFCRTHFFLDRFRLQKITR